MEADFQTTTHADALPVVVEQVLKVAKPFKTHNRRFMVGAEIAADDIAGSALDFEHLKERGFVA